MRGWRIAVMAAVLALAGCGAGDRTRPLATIKTHACERETCGNAMVMSADGARVAVAGPGRVEIFDSAGKYGGTEITVGADLLASSPDGAFLLLQHTDGPLGIRVFEFATGRAIFRQPGVITGLVANDRVSPFRKGGAGLEVSPRRAYEEVQALDWRMRIVTRYVMSTSDGGGQPYMIAVAEDLDQSAWLRDMPDGSLRMAFARRESDVTPAAPAWDDQPERRVFSRDGSLFAAQLKGMVAVWRVKDGKITDRMDEMGGCMLAGGGAPRANQLTAACADQLLNPTRMRFYRFPGREIVADLKTEAGWVVSRWQMADSGERVALLESRDDNTGSYRRVRIVSLVGGPETVIQLGKLDRSGPVLISMSASGRKLAVRMPDGKLLIYAPESPASAKAS